MAMAVVKFDVETEDVLKANEVVAEHAIDRFVDSVRGLGRSAGRCQDE
jgi:hypothetical protein